MKKKKFKFKKGDKAQQNKDATALLHHFRNGPRVVTRVEDTPDLSYEHQFVYFEMDGKEHGFYSKALEIAK